MIIEILRWFGYAILGYFIVMQVFLLVLSLLSGWELRRIHITNRFGRVADMMSSQTSPPISIVIPAYNEEAGIVEAVRSMSIVGYPRFELVIVNDGSTDDTLGKLIAAFDLERVRIPYRPDIPTALVRAFYRGRGTVDITLLDKENAGRADALNAGINAARFPYALCTDADVILDAGCLVGAMKRFVEDRVRTVAVGGNIRPINGSKVYLGHLVRARVPRHIVPRMQLLEYLRTFLASRPAWSMMGALPLISGAFGVWKRSAIIAVGGFTVGHLGEDMDMTLRLHRYHRDQGIPYRMVYEPSAVIWTEVPETLRVLRRQRTRWHRGLMRIVRENRSLAFRPRYGVLGMVVWPSMIAFEYLAPVIEAAGWLLIPLVVYLGAINLSTIWLMLLLAFTAGLINSLVALLLDESYGYFNDAKGTGRLLVMALIENFGMRQLTVAWRIQAMFGGRTTHRWGDMERRGVTNLGREKLAG